MLGVLVERTQLRGKTVRLVGVVGLLLAHGHEPRGLVTISVLADENHIVSVEKLVAVFIEGDATLVRRLVSRLDDGLGRWTAPLVHAIVIPAALGRDTVARVGAGGGWRVVVGAAAGAVLAAVRRVRLLPHCAAGVGGIGARRAVSLLRSHGRLPLDYRPCRLLGLVRRLLAARVVCLGRRQGRTDHRRDAAALVVRTRGRQQGLVGHPLVHPRDQLHQAAAIVDEPQMFAAVRAAVRVRFQIGTLLRLTGTLESLDRRVFRHGTLGFQHGGDFVDDAVQSGTRGTPAVVLQVALGHAGTLASAAVSAVALGAIVVFWLG